MPSSLHATATASPKLLILLPGFLLVAVAADIGTSARHGLLAHTISWCSICTYTALRVGGGIVTKRRLLEGGTRQTLAWTAGALLALSTVQERGTGDGGRAIWWAKCLLPLTIFALSRTNSLVLSTGSTMRNEADTLSKGEEGKAHQLYGSKTLLLVLSASAVSAAYTASGTTATLSLGLSYTAFMAMAFMLVERASQEVRQASQRNGGATHSANGLLMQSSGLEQGESILEVIRDVSAVAALGTGVAACMLERLPFSFGEMASWGIVSHDDQWMMGKAAQVAFLGLGRVMIQGMVEVGLLIMIYRRDPFTTSFVPLTAAVGANLVENFNFGRVWFAIIGLLATVVFLDDHFVLSSSPTAGASSRMRMRVVLGKVVVLIALASFAILGVMHLRLPLNVRDFSSSIGRGQLAEKVVAPPASVGGPLEYTNSRVHPVDQLVRDAEAAWMATEQRQSQTLEDAMAEYTRRYQLPPPPNFDKWYAFAKRRNVQLMDEYDTIYHSLLPFWALPPATIRGRVREALGFGGNNLMGVLIRDGHVAHVEGGQEWLQEAVQGMLKDFVEFLPDMDLAFNVHDEPRVVVPHDELSRLVHIAKNTSIPTAGSNPHPRNAFSARPADVKNSKRISEVKQTRFNVFAHQHTWLPSRLSCSPDSPARCLDEAECADNLTAYALSDLGFIYNHTAFSDICNSPSFANSHGFFDRPNAFNLVHELFPIFSQSKISSFQDIVYPSPWYWYGKVAYEEEKDPEWPAKINRLWWRGSTTGGFSRDGGWRRQHRQQLVTKLNAPDTALIIKDAHNDDAEAWPEWRVQSVPRADYSEVIDVHFSHVGQCDPGDCDAQREFFDVAPPADQQDAWKYRYLLDIDGNAFSGRFYAFLRSRSLTFKMAVFREWHEEWLRPWVHYVPLSLRGDEALEAVRYLSAETEGKAQAIRMAAASREWAGRALRKDDFEAWFFRLLLEYGRVVDDNRESIGYPGG